MNPTQINHRERDGFEGDFAAAGKGHAFGERKKHRQKPPAGRSRQTGG